MASGSLQNEPRNLGWKKQNLLADTLAAMQRCMAEQDARIAKQMEEI